MSAPGAADPDLSGNANTGDEAAELGDDFNLVGDKLEEEQVNMATESQIELERATAEAKGQRQLGILKDRVNRLKAKIMSGIGSANMLWSGLDVKEIGADTRTKFKAACLETDSAVSLNNELTAFSSTWRTPS